MLYEVCGWALELFSFNNEIGH